MVKNRQVMLTAMFSPEVFVFLSRKESGISPTRCTQSRGNPPLHARVLEMCSPPTPCPLHSSSKVLLLTHSCSSNSSPSHNPPYFFPFQLRCRHDTHRKKTHNTCPDGGERIPLILIHFKR